MKSNMKKKNCGGRSCQEILVAVILMPLAGFCSYIKTEKN